MSALANTQQSGNKTMDKKLPFCFGDPCNNALNEGICENQHRDSLMCGPLAWKKMNNIVINGEDLEPLALVRYCKQSCWSYGHKILRACNGKIKDIVVDKHTCYGKNETITGYWYYLIINYYNDDDILQPCQVTVHTVKEITADISDYILRNPKYIVKKDFVSEEYIDKLIRLYPD